MNKIKYLTILFCPVIAILVAALMGTNADAYTRYKNNAGDPGSNCSACHGDFTDATSPKGNLFPGGSKHEMHRNNASMNTACNLCHSQGDNDNPFIGSSNGTTHNPGLGCTGCHEKTGLRAHHFSAGVTSCRVCHSTDPTSPAEDVLPPYYGTIDTSANNPCNDRGVANTDENWTIGDFLGLDNDGDGLYDGSDTDCLAGNDIDQDGVPDGQDNCPTTPNPDQADTNPPAGNNCGDACECEGNFDADQDQDGTDAFTFKQDFGRSAILNSCTNADPCNGDFSCDVDVDGTDAFTFKSDFGRSTILNPCSNCVTVPWCVYP